MTSSGTSTSRTRTPRPSATIHYGLLFQAHNDTVNLSDALAFNRSHISTEFDMGRMLVSHQRARSDEDHWHRRLIHNFRCRAANG